jgi:hypothetical protein
MRLVLANWNIGWLSKENKELVIEQALSIDAYVIVFTESTSLLELPDFKSVHSDESPHEYENQMVSIFSKYPIERQLETFDSNRTCCAIIESSVGRVIVYGTIIPHHNAGISGSRYPVSGYAAWEYHYEDIKKQSNDWARIKSLYPDLPFILAGNFNQVRDGEKGGDKTKFGNELLSSSLLANDLVSLTDFSFGKEGLLRLNSWTGMFRRNVDHICISELLKQEYDVEVGAWDEFTNNGYLMSDHNGTFVTITEKYRSLGDHLWLNALERNKGNFRNCTEFNEKWKRFLKEGAPGAEIENMEVLKYLDSAFITELKVHRSFEYSQIKLKLGKCRVYSSSINKGRWEKRINAILSGYEIDDRDEVI